MAVKFWIYSHSTAELQYFSTAMIVTLQRDSTCSFLLFFLSLQAGEIFRLRSKRKIEIFKPLSSIFPSFLFVFAICFIWLCLQLPIVIYNFFVTSVSAWEGALRTTVTLVAYMSLNPSVAADEECILVSFYRGIDLHKLNLERFNISKSKCFLSTVNASAGTRYQREGIGRINNSIFPFIVYFLVSCRDFNKLFDCTIGFSIETQIGILTTYLVQSVALTS